MHALASKNAHVPFRDSKLTQLLQVGGQQAAVLTASVGPSCHAKSPCTYQKSATDCPNKSVSPGRPFLQDSLSGQAKTMMFMHVAPEVGWLLDNAQCGNRAQSACPADAPRFPSRLPAGAGGIAGWCLQSLHRRRCAAVLTSLCLPALLPASHFR